MSLLQLFFIYIKIGAQSFGGGYTMLPLIENEFVKKRQVIEEDELYRLFALSQSLPGLIAVNLAIFLGHRLRGVGGALVAAGGVILPSIVIITLIAAFFRRFADIPAVQHVFHGLNIAVLVIIAQALWKMAKTGLTDVVTMLIFAVVTAASLLTDFNPVFFAIGGALAGLLLAGREVEHRG